jgi:hypothetical protein
MKAAFNDFRGIFRLLSTVPGFRTYWSRSSIGVSFDANSIPSIIPVSIMYPKKPEFELFEVV